MSPLFFLEEVLMNTQNLNYHTLHVLFFNFEYGGVLPTAQSGIPMSAWLSVGLRSCLGRVLAHRIRRFLTC
jgi:hypothetical protein